MKILMVDASIGNDYSVCLCGALYSKGADVSLIVPQNKEISSSNHFIVLKLSPGKDSGRNKIRKGIFYIKYFIRLYRLIRKEKADAVHYQFFRRRDEIFFYLILRFAGIKVFHTAHNVLPHSAKRYDFLINKLLYKASSGIIAHSNFIKSKIITEFNISPGKIAVIPHGNFDLYLPQTLPDRSIARRKFGFSDKDKVLLFFGGIRDYKGLDTLLQAFKLLAGEENYKLLIAGAPQDRETADRYERMIKNIGPDRINYNFSFIPNQDVPLYFISGDVLLLPYKNIYHSGLIHLAYSFGKPVIASRVGDFEEVISQDRSGILLDENTPEDLSCKIREFFSNGKREELESLIKQVSKSKYSWENIASQTLNFYKLICSN